MDFCVTLCPVTELGNSSFAVITIIPLVSLVSSLQLLGPNGMAGGGPTTCKFWQELTFTVKFNKMHGATGIL
jgi:hypothetical protein